MKICVCTQRAEVVDLCARAATSVACSTTFRNDLRVDHSDWGEFDLIVVDGETGAVSPFLSALRNASDAFILCLVDRSRLRATAELVESGADSVLATDIGFSALKAHFLGISRHKGSRAYPNSLAVGEFVLNRTAGSATWRGRRIDFGSQRVVFRLFAILLENAGEIVSHQAIWRQVWPNSKLAPRTGTIQRTIWRLRRLLKDITGDEYVWTVRNEGYRFAGDSGDDAPAPERAKVESRDEILAT